MELQLDDKERTTLITALQGWLEPITYAEHIDSIQQPLSLDESQQIAKALLHRLGGTELSAIAANRWITKT